MSVNRIRDRVEVALSSPLSRLYDEEIAVHPRPEFGEVAETPGSSLVALRRYGLPADERSLFMEIQGNFLGWLTFHDRRYHALGAIGQGFVAVLPCDPSVWYVPSNSDVHPQLRYLYPAGVHPSVIKRNVYSVVDFAWRWHHLVPLIAEQAQASNSAIHKAWLAADEEGRSTLPEVDPDLRSLVELIKGVFESKDSAAMASENSLWGGLLDDVCG